MYFQYVLRLVTEGLHFASGLANSSSCRCRPWETCWPTETEWAGFRNSIDGDLVRLQPVGSVCHEPTFNRSACDNLLSISRDSAWRASQPGNSLRSHTDQVIFKIYSKTDKAFDRYITGLGVGKRFGSE